VLRGGTLVGAGFGTFEGSKRPAEQVHSATAGGRLRHQLKASCSDTLFRLLVCFRCPVACGRQADLFHHSGGRGSDGLMSFVQCRLFLGGSSSCCLLCSMCRM
jgi:hypothetical protein